jgi:hypothetical protein
MGAEQFYPFKIPSQVLVKSIYINSTSKVTVYYDYHFGHVSLAILKQAPSLKHNLTNLYCSPLSCHTNWEFGHGASQFLKLDSLSN